MDFSQVRAITIPEGNVTRILSGATVLWKKPGGLPTEYQQVEYIEGTGTQYIDLPFGFDDTDTIEARFSINTSMSSDKYVNSPKTWNNNNNRFGMGVHSASVTGYCVGFGSRATNNTFLSPRTQNDGEFHTWTYSNRGFSISELGCSLNVSNITFGGTTANLRLFYGYNAPTKCRIASYHHVKTGAKYDLIPCYRKSDNVAGLYDMVNNVFYTNAGTGVFTVGPEVFPLPSGYQQVEYVAASGTQYFNIPYTPVENDEFDIVATGTSFTVASALISCGTGGYQFIILLQGGRGFYKYFASGAASEFTAPAANAKVRYTNKGHVEQLVVTNADTGVEISSCHSSYRRAIDGTDKTLYIFKRANNTSPFGGRLYKLTIDNGNTEKLNLVPCYRIADGEIGMYDLVSATFFTNSGSGTFSKGADVG